MHPNLVQLVQDARATEVRAASDGVLLERFVQTRDEPAFAELVRRHGPLVFGVGRGLLASVQDAEDCFQAAFLTLARKAATLRAHQALGAWLFRVTRRLALRLRQSSRPHVPLEEIPMTDREWVASEMREWIALELDRLPAKYSVPLILHYFEGKTLAETAQELGWKQGTVSGRVSRALALLRQRLEQRGIAFSAAALAGWTGTVSTGLAGTTSRGVVAHLQGDGAALGAQVVRLSDGVLPLLSGVKGRVLAGLCVLLLCSGIGLALVGARPEPAPPPAPRDEKRAVQPPDPRLPSGAILRLGRERGQGLHDLVGALRAAAFSADGKTLATSDGWGGITLWDSESGRKLAAVPVKNVHLYGLSFAPDGKRIAWGGNSGVAVMGLTEVATGKELWRVAGGNRVAFTPDGKRVIGGAYSAAPQVVDADTGRVLHRLTDPDWAAIWFAPSLDGTTVAVAAERPYNPREPQSHPPRVQVWDVATGRLRQQFTPTESRSPKITSIALSPDGRTVGFEQHGRYTIAEADSGKVLKQFEHGPDRAWRFVANPAAMKQLLVFESRLPPESGLHATSLHLLDPVSGKEVRRFEGVQYPFGTTLFTPDGRRMLTYADATAVQLWDVEAGKVLPAYQGHRAGASLLALDERGTVLVSADRFYAVCIWDVVGRKMRRQLDLGPVHTMHLSADGKALVVTTSNHEVVRFDLADLASRRLQARSLRANVTPDGKRVACAKIDKVIEIIDAPGGKTLAACVGHEGVVHSVSLSADGSRLISASDTPDAGRFPDEGKALPVVADDSVRLWDAVRGKPLFRWNLATTVAVLSPDGKTMVAGDEQGRIRRFDADSGKELPALLGHQAAVRSLAFSRDGRQLASHDDAGGILLWDTVQGRQLQRVETRTEGLLGIGLSGDGRRLATSSHDATILLWEVGPAKEE